MKEFLNKLKKNYIYGILILMIIAIIALGVFLYKEKTQCNDRRKNSRRFKNKCRLRIS